MFQKEPLVLKTIKKDMTKYEFIEEGWVCVRARPHSGTLGPNCWVDNFALVPWLDGRLLATKGDQFCCANQPSCAKIKLCCPCDLGCTVSPTCTDVQLGTPVCEISFSYPQKFALPPIWLENVVVTWSLLSLFRFKRVGKTESNCGQRIRTDQFVFEPHHQKEVQVQLVPSGSGSKGCTDAQ